MGDWFLFCSQYILIASATDICHLQNDAQHCYELTQSTLSFRLPDFPSPTALLQAIPWEEFMYLHGSRVSPVVCHKICCNEFPKHCGFEWLLSNSLFCLGELKYFLFSLREIPRCVPHISSRKGAFCLCLPCRFSTMSGPSLLELRDHFYVQTVQQTP